MFKKIHICRHEIGLYFIDGELNRVLTGGDHWVRRGRRYMIEVRSKLEKVFKHPLAELIVRDERLAILLRVRLVKDDD